MTKDPRVDGPSLGPNLPPPKQTTKKTTKTTFDSQEAAEKFLRERQAQAAEANKNAKVTLKLTPAAQQTQPKVLAEVAKAQTTELKGASRTEQTAEASLRQQGKTSTGGVASKSLPLPPASIGKPDTAVLARVLDKMGRAPELSALLQNGSVQAQMMATHAELFPAQPVTRWTIMLMLLQAHALNRAINNAAADASFSAAAMNARADRMMSVLDRASTNVLARCKAIIKEIEGETALLKGYVDGRSAIDDAFTTFHRIKAEAALTQAQKSEAQLESAREAGEEYKRALESNDPARIKVAYKMLRDARVAAGLDAAPASENPTDAHHKSAKETVDKGKTQSLEAEIADAKTRLAEAGAQLQAAYANNPKPVAKAGSRVARSHVQAEAFIAKSSLAQERVTLLDKQNFALRQQIADLRGKEATLSDAEKDDLRALESEQRRVNQRQAYVAQMSSDVSDRVTKATERVNGSSDDKQLGVIGDLEALYDAGRISEAELKERTTKADKATAVYVKAISDPKATPDQVAAAEDTFNAELIAIEEQTEKLKAEKSERSPEQVKAYLKLWTLNRTAQAASKGDATASAHCETAIAKIRAELVDVDEALARQRDPGARADLLAQRGKLNEQLAESLDRRKAIENRTNIRSRAVKMAQGALVFAQHVYPNAKGDARFENASTLDDLGAQLQAALAAADRYAETKGELEADSDKAATEREQLVGDASDGMLTGNVNVHALERIRKQWRALDAEAEALHEESKRLETELSHAGSGRRAAIEERKTEIATRQKFIEAYPHFAFARYDLKQKVKTAPASEEKTKQEAQLAALHLLLGDEHAGERYAALDDEYRQTGKSELSNEARREIDNRIEPKLDALRPMLGELQLAAEERRLKEELDRRPTRTRTAAIEKERADIGKRRGEAAEALAKNGDLLAWDVPFKSKADSRKKEQPEPDIASLDRTMESEFMTLLAERDSPRIDPTRAADIDARIADVADAAKKKTSAPSIEKTKKSDDAKMALVSAQLALSRAELAVHKTHWAKGSGDTEKRTVRIGVPPQTHDVRGDAEEITLVEKEMSAALSEYYRFNDLPEEEGLVPPEANTPYPPVAAENAVTAPDAAFAKEFGTWEARDGHFVLTALPTDPVPTLTLAQLNNPDAIQDETTRAAAKTFRQRAALARIQILNAQNAAGLEAVRIARDEGIPPGYARIMAEHKTKMARLQGDARRAEEMAWRQVELEGFAAAHTPRIDPKRAVDALRAWDDARTVYQDAVGARSKAKETREALEKKSDTTKPESNELKEARRIENEAATAATAAKEELDKRGKTRDAERAKLDPIARTAPAELEDLGRTAGGWMKKIFVDTALPLAGQFLPLVANVFVNIGNAWSNAAASIQQSAQQAEEIYDGVFNQLHSELRQLEQQSQVDWMQKMNLMRVLIDAHVKAGGKAG